MKEIKNWREYEVNSDTVEEGTEAFVVVADDPDANYDVCDGFYASKEVAIWRAKKLNEKEGKELYFVANGKDYIEGNYDIMDLD